MKGRDGFALIGALWLLVVIAAVGLEFGLEARDRRLAAINRLEEMAARSAADAGVQHARARLERLLDRSGRPFGHGGSASSLDPWAGADSILADTVEMGKSAYRVEIQDLGTRLHLNRASEDEIRRLLEALRVDSGSADRIAQSILDWRDPDDLHRARGAESDWYIRQGASVLPRNGAFRRLTELLEVKDLTPEIHERVRPYLTLQGSGRINLFSAERPVLLALPGMSEEAVAVLLRLRRSGRPLGSVADLAHELSPAAQEALQAELPTLLARTTTETEELEVRSEGWTPGGRIHVRESALFVRAGRTVFLVGRTFE